MEKCLDLKYILLRFHKRLIFGFLNTEIQIMNSKMERKPLRQKDKSIKKKYLLKIVPQNYFGLIQTNGSLIEIAFTHLNGFSQTKDSSYADREMNKFQSGVSESTSEGQANGKPVKPKVSINRRLIKSEGKEKIFLYKFSTSFCVRNQTYSQKSRKYKISSGVCFDVKIDNFRADLMIL